MIKLLNWIGRVFSTQDIDYEETLGEEARPHWVKDNDDEYIEAMLNSEKVLTDD